MKKKILSLLLAVVMVVTLLPVTAFANTTSELNFTIGSITKEDFTKQDANNIVDASPDEVCEASKFYFYLFDANNGIIAYSDQGNWKDANGDAYPGTPDFSNVAYVIEEIEFSPYESFEETMTIKVNGGNALAKLSKNNLHTGVEGYHVEDNTLYVDIGFDIESGEQLNTIADILPADFPLCVDIMPSNTWVNGKGINLMLIQYTLGLITNDGEKDRVLAEDIRTTILTKTGDNYTYANNGVTTTFIMLNNTLFSVKVNGLTGDLVDFNGTYILSHTHDNIKFLPWDTTGSLPNEEGSYYLDTDVTLSSTWNVPEGTTNLCLNGHIIKMGEGKTGSVIKVDSGATLNLYDCNGSNQSHKFTVGEGGLWTLNETSGTETVTGGCITGGTEIAVKVCGDSAGEGVFTMTGGNIVGNTATSGAGVYLEATSGSGEEIYPCTFNMTGGRIIGNRAAGISNFGMYFGGMGGGVLMNGAGSKFNMTGGEICRNTAYGNGGGVEVSDGTITLGGTAKITDNLKGTAANNLYLGNYGGQKTVTLGTNGDAPATGFSVGVTLAGGTGVFTGENGANYHTYFTPDAGVNYKVVYNKDKKLELVKESAVTVDPDITNGTVTASAADGKAFEGDTVTITVTPDSGYQLKANSLKASYNDGGNKTCELTSGEGNTYTFKMPAYAVTVTAEFEKNVKITGSDDKPVGDQGAISAARSTISNVETTVAGLITFNGTGTDNAGSVSIHTVLGEKGYVDVKLTGVEFEKKAADTTSSTEITTFVFDVTPYKVVGGTAMEQHTLDNVVTFRLPLLSTAYKYANVYHGTTFLKQVALSNTDTYIEVSSKNFSEYSYTLTDTKYVVPSGGSSFTQTFSTDLDKITSVKVDGNAVNSKYYTVSGKNITLTEEFLNTLANGSHTFAAYGTINNVAKVATATFYITGNSANVTNPNTGDTSNIGLGVALMLISSLGAAACLKDGKKRRNTQ